VDGPRRGDVMERTFPEDDLEVTDVLIRSSVGALVGEGTPMLKVVHDAASNDNTVAPR
jgi:hypothetical protein